MHTVSDEISTWISSDGEDMNHTAVVGKFLQDLIGGLLALF
jgi:hypothetical protein